MANEIQISIVAPKLEAAIKALTDAVLHADANDMSAQAAPVTVTAAAQATPVTTTPVQVVQTLAAQTAPAQAAQATTIATPGVTLEAIVAAGAGLVEKGLMNQVIALLGKYNVQAVNQIQPPQYDAFAAELRALGAQI